jgi:glutathione S-transferase
MIELVTLPPAFGMRNVSPFCLKIEMLLKQLDMPFTMSSERDPRKAPKGKLPFVIIDGKQIADSELITEYLNEISNGKVFAALSDEQKGVGLALTRLAEDHLYWLMVASRWLDDEWWPNIANGFFGFVPGLLRGFVSGLARKQVAKTYDLQGLGRHTLEEQKGFARRDLDALQGALPKQGFLFGPQPGIYDFTVAAMLAGIYDNQPVTWLTLLAADYDDLRRYAERVQESVGVWGRK